MNKIKEDWLKTKWRPAMGWMYMTVCIFDFILFPIGFTVVQFWEVEAANDAFRQWQPITLVGAGLFHMAMGAVLGIAAWSRGQEKIQGVSSSSGYEYPSSRHSTFEKSSETMSVTPISRSNNKKAPVQEDEPEL